MKERHPDFVAQLEEHGLMYITIHGDKEDPSSVTGSSWKTAFQTDDKNIAEERAVKKGTKLEWMGNTAKLITGPIPAISLPASERQNASAELGSGDPVDEDVMKDMLRILKEECVAIPWKKGDVLLVNNLTVLHSRRPLIKPPRRILASLCK
ncbi:putative TauD/TfdA-like domain, taurine dioxygenase TauD-like superfamily [Helianthus annuus]|nr:putative TauD/TfdA-like domain, taurine dioxygenase TauD-like superfamily [Helianthus annuus]